MQLLAKGKRGITYLTTQQGKKIVIKEENKSSTALNRIQNEIVWLKRLNAYNIGPKLIWSKEKKFAMEYITGTLFEAYIKTHDWKKVSLDVLQQCHIIDTLKVNKMEMQNPYKHIIIRNHKPILIDFERCKINLQPKNVTQFCQYLMKLKLIKDKEQLRKRLEEYKKDFQEKYFRKIISLVIKE